MHTTATRGTPAANRGPSRGGNHAKAVSTERRTHHTVPQMGDYERATLAAGLALAIAFGVMFCIAGWAL